MQLRRTRLNNLSATPRGARSVQGERLTNYAVEVAIPEYRGIKVGDTVTDPETGRTGRVAKLARIRLIGRAFVWLEGSSVPMPANGVSKVR